MKHQPNDLKLDILSRPGAYGGMTFVDSVADSRRKHATPSSALPPRLTDLWHLCW